MGVRHDKSRLLNQLALLLDVVLLLERRPPCAVKHFLQLYDLSSLRDGQLVLSAKQFV